MLAAFRHSSSHFTDEPNETQKSQVIGAQSHSSLHMPICQAFKARMSKFPVLVPLGALR